MADEINYSDINEKFPLAGKDNDSQVFRNNFTLIKENWKLTKDVIDALQQNSASINGPNDFAGNEILNAVLANSIQKVDTTRINGVLGDAVGNIYVNIEDGVVHVIKAKRDLRINVSGWEDITGYQSIRLLITTDDGPRRCDIINPNGFITSNLPNTDPSGNPYVYALPGSTFTAVIVDVFTYDKGANVQCYIHTDYSGFLDDGTIPGSNDLLLDNLSGILPLPDFYEQEGSTDSFENVSAIPVNQDGSFNDGTIPTDLILVQDPEGALGDLHDEFFTGQTLRILGGQIAFDTDGNLLDKTTTDVTSMRINEASESVGAEIIVPDDDLETEFQTWTYRIHAFDLRTGEVSTGTDLDLTKQLRVNTAAVFNELRYLKITFDRPSTSQGILIYRSVDSGPFYLIDVLGSKQMGALTSNIIYADYAGVSFVNWSRKLQESANGKDFDIYGLTTGTNQMPVISTGVDLQAQGWVDVEILDVGDRNQDGSFTIRLTSKYYFSNPITLFLDDTSKLQKEINRRRDEGIDYLKLANRKYTVSQLMIPNNFTLMGGGPQTILKKQDWAINTSLAVLKAQDTVPNNIILKDFLIDGNQQNQYHRNDNNNTRLNYAIDLEVDDEIDIGLLQVNNETLPGKVTIENIVIENCLGGGIWMPSLREIVIKGNRITNQGMSDVYDYGPLKMEASLDFIVTNNQMSNHAGSVDISVTERGVFSNNIVNACGAGVEVFSAKFLLSSPNVLIGPNNEFLAGPDIFNSEYDQVNIVLSKDIVYTSDRYVYQENGEVIDLTANSGTIEGRLYQLRKVDNVEELYSEFLIDGRKPIVMDSNVLSLQEGEFGFRINNNLAQSDVNYILDNGSYSALRKEVHESDSTLITDPNHIGLVYRILHRTYDPIGTPSSLTLQDRPNVNSLVALMSPVDNIFIGSEVRLFGFNGLVGTNTLNTATGIITDVRTEIAEEMQIVVEFDAEVTAPGNIFSLTGTETSSLATETSQILAAGRVQ